MVMAGVEAMVKMPDTDSVLIDQALAVVAKRVRKPNGICANPGNALAIFKASKNQDDYDRIKLGCVFLDSENRWLGEIYFPAQDKLLPASEHKIAATVAKKGLQLNATGSILYVQQDDIMQATTLRALVHKSLEHLDMRVVDSVVIGRDENRAEAQGIGETNATHYQAKRSRGRR